MGRGGLLVGSREDMPGGMDDIEECPMGGIVNDIVGCAGCGSVGDVAGEAWGGVAECLAVGVAVAFGELILRRSLVFS